MPAAELTRLRTQINSLIVQFGNPEGFHHSISSLLDLYANRAYRPGQAIKPQPLIPSYRVPPLVIQQLEQELSKTCQEQPQQALDIVEVLWHDQNLEPRMLATSLLGAIPLSLSGVENQDDPAIYGEMIIQKLRAWAQPSENFRMLDALFRKGTTRLRKTAPTLLLNLLDEWLNSSHTDIQALGIRALVPLIEDPAFENLPPVFRLLSPLVQSAPAPLYTDLQAVLETLAKRTPTETAFFLRQTLSMATGQGTARLIRHCLPRFNPAQQASLRSAMQTANPR